MIAARWGTLDKLQPKTGGQPKFGEQTDETAEPIAAAVAASVFALIQHLQRPDPLPGPL